MFRNIGKTIQRFAIILSIVLFLLLAAFGTLCLLTALEEGTDKTLQTAGIQAAVISFVLALILPSLQLFLMYGFGTLIRDARQQAEDGKKVRDMLQAALADGLLSDEVARKVGQVQSKLISHLQANAPAQQPQNARAPMQRPVTEPTQAPAQRTVAEPTPMQPIPQRPPVAITPEPVTVQARPVASVALTPPVQAIDTSVAAMAASSAQIVDTAVSVDLTPSAADVDTSVAAMATSTVRIVDAGAPVEITPAQTKAKEEAAIPTAPAAPMAPIAPVAPQAYRAPMPATPMSAATLLRPDEETF